MAKTRFESVGLTTDETPKVVGSITIDFIDAGGQMIPRIAVNQLGRINPNTIERFLPFIYREIQRAQVEERRRGDE